MVVFLPFFLCRFFGDLWPCFNFAVFNITRFFSNLNSCRFFCIMNCLPHLPFFPRMPGFSRFLYFICLFRPFVLVLKLFLFEVFFFLPFSFAVSSVVYFLSYWFFPFFFLPFFWDIYGFPFFFSIAVFIYRFFFLTGKKNGQRNYHCSEEYHDMLCCTDPKPPPFRSQLKPLWKSNLPLPLPPRSRSHRPHVTR